MSSTGNGAMTLSVEDFSKRGKRGFLCFSFTHAVEMVLQRERIGGLILFLLTLRRPVLMSPDPLR